MAWSRIVRRPDRHIRIGATVQACRQHKHNGGERAAPAAYAPAAGRLAAATDTNDTSSRQARDTGERDVGLRDFMTFSPMAWPVSGAGRFNTPLGKIVAAQAAVESSRKIATSVSFARKRRSSCFPAKAGRREILLDQNAPCDAS